MTPEQQIGRWFWLVIIVIATAWLLTLFSRPAHAEIASWYGDELAGRPMANGEPFDPRAMTCASREHPVGAILLLTGDGGTTWCEVNDYGPAAWTGRDIDLSEQVFSLIADLKVGVIGVSVERLR